MRTRIKMCGMTQAVDVVKACELGVDAIGLVFCPTSPRNVELPKAQELIAACSPLVSTVALFRNPERDTVKYLLDELAIDYLQFHGDEPVSFCASFDIAYIKAIPMGDENVDTAGLIGMFDGSADALLFDSHSSEKSGGNGEVFDWSQLPSDIATPVIVAGGLQADNVTDAIAQLRPYAVDVSSGIESTKGIKDHHLMTDFVMAVREADTTRAGGRNG